MTTAEAMALAGQHEQSGELSQAEGLYRRILEVEPRNASARYQLAQIYLRQRRHAEAIPLFQQVLQQNPGGAVMHNQLGLALYAESRYTEAIASFQQALRLQPTLAAAASNLGMSYAMRAEWDAALAAHRQALALNGRYVAGWISLGSTHARQFQLEEAIKCYRQALTLEPENVLALNLLGNALLSQGEAAAAGECQQQALRLRPDYALAARSLAEILGVMQRWDEAAACLQASLALQPSDPETHAALGDVWYRLGRDAEALTSFRHVLALRPRDPKARLLADTLAKGMRLTRMPVDFLIAQYDPRPHNFDQQRQQWRGDRTPAFLQAAAAPAPPAPSLAVLDLGCGTGLCGALFRTWAQTLIGVELSPNMLARARARGVYDELIQSDLLAAVQTFEARFDLILAADVVCYLGDLTALWQAIRRALRPGGRFVFTFELNEGPEDYCLIPLLHFAHSRTYLQNLARTNQLREIAAQQVYLARENGYYGTAWSMVVGCE